MEAPTVPTACCKALVKPGGKGPTLYPPGSRSRVGRCSRVRGYRQGRENAPTLLCTTKDGYQSWRGVSDLLSSPG